MKKIVIIGATSGIAEHCARLMVAEPADLFLVGRSAERLEAMAADLRVRSPRSRIRCCTCDFLDEAAIGNTVATMHRDLGGFDSVLIAHGTMPEQQDCLDTSSQARYSLEVNGISPVLFAEAFARYMAAAGQGTLAVIGSVAGDRGRKSNYVYGSAKALVDRYLQGMQHRFANSGVRVVLIKPGPTETPMTAHLKGGGMKLADPVDVAKDIVQGMEQGRRIIYTPAKWRVIMMVIRHLPWFVFKRMNI